MSDILKHITHPATNHNDPEGNLLELAPWSERDAMERAATLGLALTDNHWDVVLFVRDYYRGRGRSASAREIMSALEKEFAEDGGKRWLYQLFPEGPITASSIIAGIPLPPHSKNPSFGTVH